MAIDRDKHRAKQSRDTVSSQDGATARAEVEKLRQQVADQAELISRLRAHSDRDTAGEDDGGGGDGGARAWGSRRSQNWRDERDGGIAGDADANAAGLSEAMIEAAETATSVAQQEADELRQQLAVSERELQRMERRVAAAAAAGGGDAPLAAAAALWRSSSSDAEGEVGPSSSSAGRLLEQENRRLQDENDKLSRELQAFDLEFFEEIEDLKYKYTEAARKLRQYEERSSSR